MDVLLPSHTVEDNHDAVLLSGCTILGSLHFLQNNAQKLYSRQPKMQSKKPTPTITTAGNYIKLLNQTTNSSSLIKCSTGPLFTQPCTKSSKLLTQGNSQKQVTLLFSISCFSRNFKQVGL